MQKSEKISFVENATTKEALCYSVWFAWVFVRNIAKAINGAAHRLPWVFIFLTVLISSITSYVFIAQARAERDDYNKENAHLNQQLDSYKAVYGDGKEAN